MVDREVRYRRRPIIHRPFYSNHCYSSYGVDSATPSTVPIASYCWTNDAERLGSLINTGRTEYTEQLTELVLRNLVEVHNMPYDDLINEYEKMHAWDWNHNPLTGGESVDVDVSQSFAHSFCHRCICVLRARRFPGFVHVSHCTNLRRLISSLSCGGRILSGHSRHPSMTMETRPMESLSRRAPCYGSTWDTHMQLNYLGL